MQVAPCRRSCRRDIRRNHATEVVQPSKESFDFPAPTIAPKNAAILGLGFAAILLVGCYQFHPAVLAQFLI